MPSLYDLAAQLRAYADGALDRAALEAWCAPVLAGEPLGAEGGDDATWREAPDEERLYWRLLYLLETAGADDAALRALVGRVLDCLASTGRPDDTLELLPLVSDAPRLCTIVARRAEGRVSRTGFLNVVANAGYPPHAKLWLTRAGPRALDALCAAIGAGAWGTVARLVERAPADRADDPAPAPPRTGPDTPGIPGAPD